MKKFYHEITTASSAIAELISGAAARLGIEYRREYRPTMCKCYAIRLYAEALPEIYAADLMILASTAHTEQKKYIQKLQELTPEALRELA